MRVRMATLAAMVLSLGALPLTAQSVVIKNATPTLVVDHLKGRLLPQGYKIETANDKGALFTFYRGVIAQQGNPAVPFARITLEVHFRFKSKTEGLSVAASEEIVGERGRPLEFRRTADSQHDALQRLLDGVRADIEAGKPPADTTAKPDSSQI